VAFLVEAFRVALVAFREASAFQEVASQVAFLDQTFLVEALAFLVGALAFQVAFLDQEETLFQNQEANLENQTLDKVVSLFPSSFHNLSFVVPSFAACNPLRIVHNTSLLQLYVSIHRYETFVRKVNRVLRRYHSSRSNI